MKAKLKRIFVFTLTLMMLFCSFTFVEAASSPDAVSIKKAKVTYSKSGYYTGEKHTVKIKVTLDGETLQEGVDYVVSGNITTASKAKSYKMKVVIEGIGHYKGSLTKKFTYKIKKDKATLVVSPSSIKVSYADLQNGSVTVQLTVKDKKTGTTPLGTLRFKCSSKLKVSSGGLVTIPQGLKKGTYKVKVAVKGNSNVAGTGWRVVKVVVG